MNAPTDLGFPKHKVSLHCLQWYHLLAVMKGPVDHLPAGDGMPGGILVGIGDGAIIRDKLQFIKAIIEDAIANFPLVFAGLHHLLFAGTTLVNQHTYKKSSTFLTIASFRIKGSINGICKKEENLIDKEMNILSIV